MMKRMTSKGKGVWIEEIVDHDVNDAVRKEFDGKSGNRGWMSFCTMGQMRSILNMGLKSFCIMTQIMVPTLVKRKWDIKIWFGDEDVDKGIDVEWQDDPYHLINEPEEISDIFADLDQALDELDQVIEAQDVINLFSSYDQPIDDEGYVVPVEGVFLANDGDVIPTQIYDAMVAQEGVFSPDDGDVIPIEVYEVMVTQEMLKDQTRPIKRKRVMADKEDEDDA
nr:hypothetical protein [Tanacetum cinerariifolium]